LIELYDIKNQQNNSIAVVYKLIALDVNLSNYAHKLIRYIF